MTGYDHEKTRRSYDAVADEYTARIYDELEHKPFDRQILREFAREVATRGPVVDMGCGPGHVARFLKDAGVADVRGIDLSPAMVEIARRLNPDIPFEVAEMLSLPVGEGAWAGIAAFYSIIHLSDAEVPRAFDEFRRVLMPGGLLLVAFHVGNKENHLQEWWGRPVDLTGYFRPRVVVEGWLRDAGFSVDTSLERPPIPDVEYESRRCYLFARTPPPLT